MDAPPINKANYAKRISLIFHGAICETNKQYIMEMLHINEKRFIFCNFFRIDLNFQLHRRICRTTF